MTSDLKSQISKILEEGIWKMEGGINNWCSSAINRFMDALPALLH